MGSGPRCSAGVTIRIDRCGGTVRPLLRRTNWTRDHPNLYPAMHHLILLRESDQQMSSSGCCGRLEGDAAFWSTDGCVFPERRETMNRIGEIYRAVRHTFGERVEITIIDPRNWISFVALLIRDAVRHRVPPLTVLRSILAANLTTGVLDGQLLFAPPLPSPASVVDLIAGRLSIDYVGSASASV